MDCLNIKIVVVNLLPLLPYICARSYSTIRWISIEKFSPFIRNIISECSKWDVILFLQEVDAKKELIDFWFERQSTSPRQLEAKRYNYRSHRIWKIDENASHQRIITVHTRPTVFDTFLITTFQHCCSARHIWLCHISPGESKVTHNTRIAPRDYWLVRRRARSATVIHQRKGPRSFLSACCASLREGRSLKTHYPRQSPATPYSPFKFLHNTFAPAARMTNKTDTLDRSDCSIILQSAVRAPATHIVPISPWCVLTLCSREARFWCSPFISRQHSCYFSFLCPYVFRVCFFVVVMSYLISGSRQDLWGDFFSVRCKIYADLVNFLGCVSFFKFSKDRRRW